MESINPDKSLGPYGANGKKSSTFKVRDFSDLEEGQNKETVVLGKVFCSVHSEIRVPL